MFEELFYLVKYVNVVKPDMRVFLPRRIKIFQFTNFFIVRGEKFFIVQQVMILFEENKKRREVGGKFSINTCLPTLLVKLQVSVGLILDKFQVWYSH
jgi:hypothetical protein